MHTIVQGIGEVEIVTERIATQRDQGLGHTPDQEVGAGAVEKQDPIQDHAAGLQQDPSPEAEALEQMDSYTWMAVLLRHFFALTHNNFLSKVLIHICLRLVLDYYI